MTDQQITQIVDSPRISEADKAVLLRSALSGKHEARFVVKALQRRLVPSACP
jgi:hypothetical protein